MKSLDEKVFLLEYVLSNFEPRLTDDEKERLKATCMGVKVRTYKKVRLVLLNSPLKNNAGFALHSQSRSRQLHIATASTNLAFRAAPHEPKG